MDFSAPDFLWLLFLIPLVVIPGLFNERFSGRVRKIFVCPPTPGRRLRAAGRLLAAPLTVISLVGALAGPGIWALRPEDPRRALTLAVGIDVSKSMLAEDVTGIGISTDPAIPPNRLDAASRLALELFDNLDDARAGLFFFARRGVEVVAPTRDRGFLRYMVRHTSLADLTESGSDLATAMQTGADLVGSADSGSPRGVVLISDGEDTENPLSEIARRSQMMRNRNIPVFTVGTGRPAEVFLPVRRPGMPGIRDFYTDSRGDYLKTRLEEKNLRTIATKTGGTYWRLDDVSPRRLARNLLDQLAGTDQKLSGPHSLERQRIDLSPVFLSFGLLFYLGFRAL